MLSVNLEPFFISVIKVLILQMNFIGPFGMVAYGGSTDKLNVQVNSIDYLKKMELELIKLELKFPTKKFNPQINLPFNLLI